ncbi:MAG: hypothetical protein ACREA9_23995 [Pyrinomonadaceae bacterium]
MLSHNISGKTFSIIAATLLFAFTTSAQESKLGAVDFPTSASGEVQSHFLRGVAALHSFWYDEAADEFRIATKLDPDFMMGYWGEAMTYNHPLWSQQDTEAGKRTVAKIRELPKLTGKERGFIEAIRKLYGEGDKLARDQAYSAAMEQLYKANPDDLEAASFYALSLLGLVRPGDKGFRRQMLAGAIALDVYRKNPNHPGAAHYIIHSFDDPEHAILALDAAKRYSEIAPAAHHARHMPSHIFLQLGMWPEAAASNESAWAVSDEWVKRKNLPVEKRDYHSLHWLLYIYLQQGRQSKAEELLSVLRDSIEQAGTESKLGRPYSSDMAAAFIVETERWDLVKKLLGAPNVRPTVKAPAVSSEVMPMPHCAHPPPAGDKTAPYISSRNEIVAAFIRGLASAATGSDEFEKSIAELRAMRGQLSQSGDSYRARQVEIMALEVAASGHASQSEFDEATELMRQARELEEQMSPPSGPPELIKPTHELFGEILLRAGRAREATQEFQASVLMEPNRARSLLGIARAATKSGNVADAVAAYTNFLNVWSLADAQLPELREARSYTRPRPKRTDDRRLTA